jgi:ATP-dependent DNA helicase RecG
LGEFLKELHLTEGRGTGLPTIHDELQRNGSPSAIIDADDEHTYFMITIPCHPEFVCDKFTMDKDGHVLPVLNGNVTENVTENGQNVTEKTDDADNVTVKAGDVTVNVIEKATNVTVNVTEAERRRLKILQLLKASSKLTVDDISNTLSVSRRTVLRDLDLLRIQGKIVRDGSDKSGAWIVKD